jgi:hypothetical protein
VSVSGGGSQPASASDATTITVNAVTMSLSENTLHFAYSGSTITDPQKGFRHVQRRGKVRLDGFIKSAQCDGLALFGNRVGPPANHREPRCQPVVTVTAAGATNSPQQIQVNIASVTPGVPYGSFDTPVNNTPGVTGSIAVTGWALDAIEVTKVDIWREPVPGEGAQSNGLVYIGDAVFVVGSRPDVETAYPRAPFSYRAGWGYLMLATGLPNNGGSPGPGNGTYRLHAIAHNKTGASPDLGTRTPHRGQCAQRQAVRGAGSERHHFRNQLRKLRMVLTPQPCSVPTDGSTIWVTVDGQYLGHPVYNNYRSDIATGLPGYANGNGAVGYFYLDTTQFTNGVHTMGWLATDSCGRTDGMGSRFIEVEN